MDKKKILVVAQWFAENTENGIVTGGGTELQALLLSKNLAENGHEIIILTPDNFDHGKGEEAFNGLRVVYFRQKSIGLRDFYSFKETLRVINHFNPETVIVFGIGFHFASGAILASKLSGKRAIYYMALHSMQARKNILQKAVDRALFSKIINLSEKIIYPSKHTKMVAEKEMNIKLQTEEIILECATEEIKKEKNLKKIKNSILFVGRLDPVQKGVYTLLESLIHVKKSFPGIKCFFYFSHSTKEKLIELEKFAEEKNIAKNIEFVSKKLARREIMRTYLRHEILVVPSFYESFGIVLLEGLKAGIPSICSDIEPLRTVCGNGKYCKMFRKGDPKDLSEKITFMLENRKQLAFFSKKGTARGKFFDNEKIFEKFRKIVAAN